MAAKRPGRKKRTTRTPRSTAPSALLFRQHPVPTWIHHPKTLAILDVNDAAVRRYGYSRKEFLTLTIESLGMSAEETRRHLAAGTQRAIVDSAPHRGKTGTLLPVRCSARSIVHLRRQAVLVAAEVAADQARERAAPRRVGAGGGGLSCRRQGHPGWVDLLMTDVLMPGMGGPELVTRAVALRPDLKVLYTSGYSDDVILRGAVHDKRARFLDKPYTTEALRRRVRDALGGPAGAPLTSGG